MANVFSRSKNMKYEKEKIYVTRYLVLANENCYGEDGVLFLIEAELLEKKR